MPSLVFAPPAGELAAVPLPRLEALVGNADAVWLARLAQGVDDAEVKPSLLPKSLSCGVEIAITRTCCMTAASPQCSTSMCPASVHLPRCTEGTWYPCVWQPKTKHMRTVVWRMRC